MSANPSPSQIRNEQIAYYGSALAKLPGTYHGNMKQYDGLTWTELYKKLADKYQSIDPGQLADGILIIANEQALGQGISAGDQTLANMLNQAGPDINKGLAQTPGVKAAAKFGDALTGIDAIGQFFNDLRDPGFWLRAGKIIGGSLILIIGLLKLTGLSEKAGSVVGKTVKAAPFL